MLSKKFYTEFIGYGGGALSLIAYLMVANNFINGTSIVFLFLNLVAGLALMIYTAHKKAYANYRLYHKLNFTHHKLNFFTP